MFKPGDIVLRTGKSLPSRNVYTNATYVVKGMRNSSSRYLTLRDVNGLFDCSRFKLVKSIEDDTDKQEIVDANVIEF